MDGGEGGIRTPQDSLDSVSYRLYNADVAVNAEDAVVPCTRLHQQTGFDPSPRAGFGEGQPLILPNLNATT